MSKGFDHTQSKQQWLAQRLKNAKTKQASFGITPQIRPRRLPLSFAQQRLWFLEQWAPGSPTYLLSHGWRFKGVVDRHAFEASLTALTARHETLRTACSIVDGQPVQVIHPVAPVSLRFQDLTIHSESTREEELQRLIHHETHLPFDLTIGPLWRGHLIRLGLEDHIFLLIFHHIITDGWSMGIVFKELSALYVAHTTGHPASLSPLPLQYADFAIWQRQWLQGQVLDRQLTYWRAQLADAPPSLELPTDVPRPPQQTYKGNKISFTLPHALTQSLKTLSQQESVTLFMTLLAAFQLLLARYAGQRDVLIGSPIAGRTHTELEGLIGFFVNTLVFRMQIIGQPTFREILHQVRETCLDAYAHQDLPFEKLVEALQPVRDPSRHPLFQVMFQLFTKSNAALEIPGITITKENFFLETAKFDLNCALQENTSALMGTLEFNSDLFASATIQRMIEHYRQLLEGLVTNPNRPVNTISVLTDEECQQLTKWNNTATSDLQKAENLSTLFESQVAKTPNAIAVVCEERHLTYAQLDARANQLARHLQAHGIHRGTFVGIFAERSLEMVISLYATLKAGAAYVPIDPAYPADRVTFMLHDAQVPVLVTQEHLRSRVPPYPGQIVSVDTDWPQISQLPSTALPRHEYGDDLAYMIYTSGSTGQPKGAMNTHRGICNRLLWMQDAYNLQSDDRVLQKTPFSFDVSVWELFWPLLTGARLVMANPEGHRDSRYLRNLILQEGITTLHFVPSMLQSFLQEPSLEACGTILRRVISSGEALSGNLQARFFDRLPTVELHNLYGPTEAAVDVTAWHCQPDTANATVPIGRPIGNIQVHLLDAHQLLMPIGLPGELHIGGVGLARGYHRRPDLTAAKFIPDPLNALHGSRLYKTGDLARYRSNGSLEYLGRLDYQVKVRGFRIELGEIEASLLQHPSVREAILVCREDTPGDQKLVAYIVPSSNGSGLELTILRSYLGTKLPDYMLPSACVLMDVLPLTPNGKVDRKALPIPGPTQRPGSIACIPPRTPVEELIADIWRDLLKVDRISVHDNFFELGGHSLLATQVMARLRPLLPSEISLRTFFDGPTIAQLSETLKHAGSGPTDLTFPPLRPQVYEGPPLLSFAQQRLWFLEQWMPGNTAYLLPYAWRLTGPLNESALETALTALVARHASLRTACAVRDGQPVQKVGQAFPVFLSVQDLTSFPAARQEEQVQHFIQNEQLQPFDLSIGPLWRGQLLRLSQEGHVLLLTLHHLITDGWSMQIFFQELSALYQNEVSGQPTVLPPLPLEYADFAVWQRQWLRGEVLDRQLTYWRTQLANVPPSLDLPTDFSRPLELSYRGGYQEFTLSFALTQSLNAFCRQEGVTLFMSLLAAFQLLLARYTGQTDILVGTPIAGRTHTELEGLIGFFVNTLVIRTRFTGGESFHDLVGQIRETCVQAYAHQDLPFEKLVEAIQPVRDPSRHPIFQVIFQLQQADSLTEFSLANLAVTPIPFKRFTAKFDLSLGMVVRDKRLHGTVTFNNELFEAETIRRLVIHYQTLLEALVAAPMSPVAQLPILSDAERRQLLLEWNPPLSRQLPMHCVHDLFDAQALATPEAIALVFEDQHLTYNQLRAEANQLACYLRQQGVKPEVCVGVCLERGLNLIISFLAILKAGGAYVPLDPSIPAERLRFILEDADVTLVLTSSSLQERFTACFASMPSPSMTKPSVIDLDKDWPGFLRETSSLPWQPVHADNLAYVMYTSGSTGQPKGVSISHRGVVRLVHKPAYIPHQTRMVCLQLASPSFDAATFEIWACLVNGGKLVLGPALLPSFDQLGTVLQEHQITLLWLTSGLFHQLVDWDLTMLRPVQTLLAGGDVLSLRHVQQVAKRLPTCQLINGYGPTENTTFTCCFSVPKNGDFGEIVPIGRPIAETQVYVLDLHQQLMPVRGAGELVIGGQGLARGYHRQPGLTAEKFIPHSFSPVPGARLYRSGDIVRHRADGNVEFFGRRDHQVKIRGYRIECGEIETVLTTHPAVREVIVLPRDDGAGQKRLIAYIRLKSEFTPSLSEFRDFLGHTLPSYMLPSSYVFMKTFPLTVNGKVNREKLPLEDEGAFVDEGKYQAPETPLEAQLTKIWEAVLGKKPIGINDNFFNLGGESLMAVRLCSAMERKLGRKIPVSLIFHTQTIKQLASNIDNREVHAPSSLMVPIQPLGVKPPIFCVLFGATFLPYMKNYLHQPLYMFFNQGHDGKPALHATVEEIAKRYLQDLRTLQPKGPYYLAGYSFGGMVAYEMAHELRRQGETIALLALVDPTTKTMQSAPRSLNKKLSHFLVPVTHLEDKRKISLISLKSICHTILIKACETMRWRLEKFQTSSWVMLKELICMSYFAIGSPLPSSLRRFYRDRVVKKASQQYHPQYYAGRIILFQTKKAVENYWGPLCKKVDHIYNLSAGHLEIVDEPYTETLLHDFMECLDRAQRQQEKIQESSAGYRGEFFKEK
ncbi:MAG: amino acid adenylation domain-containing protein [Nitrospirales bacterium]